MIDKFEYLSEGFRLYCVGPRPQYMPVGTFGIVGHTEFRAKDECLTVLEFKSGKLAKMCLDRLRVCGYDSGRVPTFERIGQVVAAAQAYAAERKAKAGAA